MTETNDDQDGKADDGSSGLRYRLPVFFLAMVGVGAVVKSVLTFGQSGGILWSLVVLVVGYIAYLNKFWLVGSVFIALGLFPLVLHVAYLVLGYVLLWDGIGLDP